MISAWIYVPIFTSNSFCKQNEMKHCLETHKNCYSISLSKRLKIFPGTSPESVMCNLHLVTFMTWWTTPCTPSLCWRGRGGHSQSLLLFEFFQLRPPSCFKVGWMGWVDHKILVASPKSSPVLSAFTLADFGWPELGLRACQFINNKSYIQTDTAPEL